MTEKGDMQDSFGSFVEMFKGTIGYFWLILLAIWGGTVNYLLRLRKGHVLVFSFTELIGEWAISGFAGLLTAFVCAEMGMSWQLTAFFTGVAGHLGGRAIYLFEQYAQARITILTGNKHEDEEESGKG